MPIPGLDDGRAAGTDASDGVGEAVERLFRHQAGQLVATLTRVFGFRHLDLVEDVVQEAFLTALRSWPYRGIPDDPAAWIVRVARNRAVDVLRRQSAWTEREDRLKAEADLSPSALGSLSGSAEEARDDQLAMIFACCHDRISLDAQVALTLKTVGGFSVPELARAFLTKPTTMAQRLVRAKRTLFEAQVELGIPVGAELASRLDAVLEVLYLMFNEGYGAHEGEDLIRRDLCQEAIRLCELLTEHRDVAEPRAHALAALMLLQGSRLAARVSSAGDAVLMDQQDRALWDRNMIKRGFWYLERAGRGDGLSRYHIEAEIAACHAAAPSYEGTDWSRIQRCYDSLCRLTGSPIAALNRAVAVAELEGAPAALAALEGIGGLDDYLPYWTLRSKLLVDAGRRREGAASYERALGMSMSAPLRRHLEGRLAELAATAE